MDNEIWVEIEGWDSKYQVSNLGRVKSIIFKNNYGCFMKDRILKPYSNKLRFGYMYIGLENNNKRKNALLHQIVAKAFISNTENKTQVNHINGIKTDNRVENLEWVTDKENKKHARDNGLYNDKKKVKGIINGEEYNFESMTEASNITNINLSSISACCKGKVKTAGGYKWELI